MTVSLQFCGTRTGCRTGEHHTVSLANDSTLPSMTAWQRFNNSVETGWGTFGNIAAAVLFLGLVFVFVYTVIPGHPMNGVIIAAGIIGAYMAINIGANDVANNMGPAVGSKSLSMASALVIAAVFEGAGAIIAGADVINTVSRGIIAPDSFANVPMFVWAMMAALLSAALWINLATVVGAPVSTTHSVIGGVAGAGIAASGIAAVNWGMVGIIAASWVISPVMGGVIAAVFLFTIEKTVIDQKDRIAAAQRWVPLFIAVMAGAFGMYLTMKGLSNVWKAGPIALLTIGAMTFIATLLIGRKLITRQARGLRNKRKSINVLFAIPLICGAALLSFAHGANDVANAVGPLAAIVAAISLDRVGEAAAIPLWVMMVGAIGLAVGLLLYGRRMIRVVGAEITKLDQTRAFCVALSAAITVLIASWLGLPVSSTHIAVGGVFGVGFLREYLSNRPAKTARKTQKRAKRRLVRRRHMMSIAAAWVITVPASATLAGLIFLGLDSVLGH